MSDSPLSRYLVPMRRWWWVMAAILVIAVTVTLATLPEGGELTEDQLVAQGTEFRATHLLIRNEDAPVQLSFELVQLLARQGDLTNRIAMRTGESIEAADVEEAELITDLTTETMSITVVRPTPSEAATLATAYADELVAFLDERAQRTIENDLQRVEQRLLDLEPSIEAAEAELAQTTETDPEFRLLEAELDSLVADFTALRMEQRLLIDQQSGLTESFLTLEEPSPVPLLAEDTAVLSLPNSTPLRLALVSATALILGLVTVLGIDYVDTRIRTRRQAEVAFGLPVISELPRRWRRSVAISPLPALNDPGGVTAEVLRALRLSISLAPRWHLTSLSRNGDGPVGTKTPVHLQREPRSIVVTSTLTGEGKSTLVANLAVSIAEGGKNVLVVDCDFRRPAVGELLDVSAGLGLRELAHVNERPLFDLAAPTIAKQVAMVRSGSRGVTPPWFMSEAAQLVEACEEIADVVIFDTGPITLTNEASALLPHVDTSLLITRSGRVSMDQARGTVEQLTQVGAHVSGVVLIASEGRRRYGYGYYKPDGKPEQGPDLVAQGPDEGDLKNTATGDERGTSGPSSPQVAGAVEAPDMGASEAPDTGTSEFPDGDVDEPSPASGRKA